MRRIPLAGALLAGALAIVTISLPLIEAAGQKKLTFKLTLPNEYGADEGKVSVFEYDADGKLPKEGKDFDGSGLKRTVEYGVKEKTKSVLVTFAWDPNNYTKITRKKKVEIGNDATVTLDFTKADPKGIKDDIVV